MRDFEEYLTAPGGTCVVAFASEPQDRFEWRGTLRRLQLPHVLMRDSRREWYSRGVAGIGDREEVSWYINKLLFRFTKVVTLGLSSGAYAALLYGLTAHVDEVIAISPVTVAGPEALGDFPLWEHRLTHDHARFPILDLAPLYLNEKYPPKVRAFYSDGPGTELDRDMATRLGLIDVKLVAGYSHDQLARGLRDDGTIEELLLGPA